jgi:hypothetical protein
MLSLSGWYDTSNRNKCFNVVFMTWKTFFKAMMDPEKHSGVLTNLAQADCVIGGVDRSTAYL